MDFMQSNLLLCSSRTLEELILLSVVRFMLENIKNPRKASSAENHTRNRVTPRFSLEGKRCEKVANFGERNSEKRVCFACFRKIAKSSFSSENDVRNEAKRSEKRPKEVKR
jgi:hypothetical protein